MIKSELIEKIATTNPHLMQRDVETIVNVIFDEITEALASRQRVELRGFGAFSVKHRPARVGRNPRTGEQVHVAEKFVPYFKTGKELRARLNPEPEPKAKAPAKAAGKTATASTKAATAKSAEPAPAKPNAKSAAKPAATASEPAKTKKRAGAAKTA